MIHIIITANDTRLILWGFFTGEEKGMILTYLAIDEKQDRQAH